MVLGFLNLWMRPCATPLVDRLRTFGALLSAWSGAVGVGAAILDAPTNKSPYEIWSVGAMGLAGAAIAGLLLFHTEGLWSRLSARSGSGESNSNSKVGATKAVAPLVVDEENESEDSEGSEKKKKKSRRVSRLTSRLRLLTVVFGRRHHKVRAAEWLCARRQMPRMSEKERVELSDVM
ncbi:hypothetical protein PybrP1_010224 [[Pythium] brassicae (nom. inval.)]|nr:hypothetical protein PybrP1_010224 [[Pythium] brassicae (nom. inval.)]